MRNDKINKTVCDIMEYQSRNSTEEIFARRKQQWLQYGRALLTIGFLGLITVILYSMTHVKSPNSSSNSNNLITSEQLSARYIVVKDEGEKQSIDTVQRDGNERFSEKIIAKRAATNPSSEEKIPKRSENSFNNLENENELDSNGQHLKILRRHPPNNNNIRHRHSDNGFYVFKGYKCVPIRKGVENLRARNRLGMCSLVCV